MLFSRRPLLTESWAWPTFFASSQRLLYYVISVQWVVQIWTCVTLFAPLPLLLLDMMGEFDAIFCSDVARIRVILSRPQSPAGSFANAQPQEFQAAKSCPHLMLACFRFWWDWRGVQLALQAGLRLPPLHRLRRGGQAGRTGQLFSFYSVAKPEPRLFWVEVKFEGSSDSGAVWEIFTNVFQRDSTLVQQYSSFGWTNYRYFAYFYVFGLFIEIKYCTKCWILSHFRSQRWPKTKRPYSIPRLVF